MSKEENGWIVATGALVFVIAMINVVPGTIFTAFSCKVVWNMFARDIYPQVTTLHMIGPMLAGSLALFRSVDCTTPDRTTGEAVWHLFCCVLRPYFLGGWFILCGWIISCFIS